MDTKEAWKLVKVIAESLRSNPGQFHLEVSVTGLKAVGGPGGPGYISIAEGPGSTGTVINSSVGPVEIRAGEIAASEAMNRELNALDSLANALAQDREDEIPGLMERLQNAAVLPATIITTVATIVQMAGLSS